MVEPQKVNILVVVVVDRDNLGEVTHRLVKSRFYFTRVDTRGGLLEAAEECLLVGIPDSRLDDLLALISTVCQTRRVFVPANFAIPSYGSDLVQGGPVMIEAEKGGATVYILGVDRFEQF